MEVIFAACAIFFAEGLGQRGEFLRLKSILRSKNMSRTYMSGISLCAIKQRCILIYFDGGADFLFGATDKSPEHLGICFRGCIFRPLA